MRIAVASDIHLGDPDSTLVYRDPHGQYQRGLKMDEFLQATGKGNDYLVLLGDALDLSIASYEEVYRAARMFFLEVREAGIAREIIYVPGNHDFSLWQTVLHQANVINRVRSLKPPKLRWTMPAVLDDHPEAEHEGLSIHRVTAQRGSGARYGGLFLDALGAREESDKGIVFNVVYPSLFFVDSRGEVTLMTHGHCFDQYWSGLSELAPRITGNDLSFAAGSMDLDEFVAINVPTNELASSAIGQAGPLTVVIRQIQKDIKAQRYGRIERYLDELQRYADELLDHPWYKEWISDVLLDAIRDAILKAVQSAEKPAGARFNADFLGEGDVDLRFQRFLHLCNEVGKRLGVPVPRESGTEKPVFQRLLFGHTHVPRPLNNPEHKLYGGDTVMCCNTGGWIWPVGTDRQPHEPVGGAVFVYDSEEGWQSTVL